MNNDEDVEASRGVVDNDGPSMSRTERKKYLVKDKLPRLHDAVCFSSPGPTTASRVVWGLTRKRAE